MKKISLNEGKAILLDILKRFNNYCNQNDMKMILAAGTCLGAVRHKGMIPWDDDIDVFLLKEDFDKLMKLAQNDGFLDQEKRFKIVVPGSENYYYPFIKIVDTHTILYEKNIRRDLSLGLYIDVFCLSYWPDDFNECLRLDKLQKKYRKLNQILICGNIEDRKYKLIYPFAYIIQKIFLINPKNIGYFSKKILQLDTYKNTAYIGDVCWNMGVNKDRFKKEMFDDLILLDFEDEKYYVPKDYDQYLTIMYGNYMKLPDEKDRRSHGFEAYYL